MEISAFPDENTGTTPRYYGLYMGQVVARDDPERRGRVRVNLPAMFDVESKWAVPIGMPGAGGPPGGGFFVPELKAQVAVGFFEGDIDNPYYMPGPPAIGEAPAEVRSESYNRSTAPDVRVFETTTFTILIIDTEDTKQLRIGTKDSNNFIEIDANDNSVYLKGDTSVILEAPIVSVTGTKIQIGNRVVMPVGPPI